MANGSLSEKEVMPFSGEEVMPFGVGSSTSSGFLPEKEVMPFDLGLPAEFFALDPDSQSEEFFTAAQTRKQRRNLRGAKTEIRRSSRQLRSVLGKEKFEAEMTSPGFMQGMMTVTEPLFDILQAGQFTTAGFFSELHKTGSGYEALRRAGSEFLNALPGIDEEEAEELTGIAPTRASYTDLLRDTELLDLTGDESIDNWLSAAGGFILDVVLDPTTYVGGLGLVKAGAKIGAARGVAYKFSPLAEKALSKIKGSPLEPGRFIGDVTSRAVEKVRDMEGIGSVIGSVRGAIGRKFKTNYDILEYGRKTGTDVSDFVGAKAQVDRDVYAGMVELKDLATELAGDLTHAERSLIMIFKDQPKKWEAILEKISAGNPNKAKLLNEKYNRFTKEFGKLWEAEHNAGLMSETAIRAHYAPGRYPDSGTGWKAMIDTMERLGKDPKMMKTEYSEYLRRVKLADEVSHVFQKAKKYDTLEKRILAAVPTDMDIANAFARRSIESVRAIATRKFAGAVLDDPNIAHLIKDQSLLATLKKGGAGKSHDEIIQEFGEEEGTRLFAEAEEFRKGIREFGFGVWRPLKKKFSEIEIKEGGKAKLKTGDRLNIDHGDGIERQVKIIKPSDLSNDAPEVLRKLVKDKEKMKENFLVKDLVSGEEYVVPKGTVAEVAERIQNPAYLLPLPFIKELNLTDKIMKNTTEGGEFWKFMMETQNIWKGWAIFSPGFHFRNAYSNVFNNWLGGVRNPKDYVNAMRLQFADDPWLRKQMKNLGHEYEAKEVSVATKELRKVNGVDKMVDVEYSGKKLMDEMRKHGVLGRNLFSQEIATDDSVMLLRSLFKAGAKKKKAMKESREELSEAIEGKILTEEGADVGKAIIETVPEKKVLTTIFGKEAEGIEKLVSPDLLRATFGLNNPALQGNRWLGSIVEDNAKAAHFLNRVRKGDSFEKASMSVKKYMFDYGELTQFEREVMKSVIPFYTWMRKNIPLQITAILENPGRYANITGKPIQAVEQLSEDWENIETPDYFAEIHAVRLPKIAASAVQTLNKSIDDLFKENGVGEEQAEMGLQPVYLNPNFPFQDLNRLNWKDLLSNMSPYIKTLTEGISGPRGYSLFLDREVERYEGEPSELSILPGFEHRPRKRWEEVYKTALPAYGKFQRMRSAFAKDKPAPQILSEFFGIKPLQIDVERVRRSKIYKKRERLRNLKRKYRDLGFIR